MSRVGAGGDNAAATLAEIEKATPQQVTVRTSSNLFHTADLPLGYPSALTAPDDRKARDGVPMLASSAGGAP